MKMDIFLVIGLIVNTLFAVLYPAQIFGTEPLGLNSEVNVQTEQYYSVNGTSVVSGYNTETGELTRDDSMFNVMQDAVTATDGSAGILTTEVFGWIDWVKVGFNLLKTMLMFVIGFIFLLWNLAYPFNFLIGVPFSMLYIFGMSSFIIGRS